jgi:hypothetical protein
MSRLVSELMIAAVVLSRLRPAAVVLERRGLDAARLHLARHRRPSRSLDLTPGQVAAAVDRAGRLPLVGGPKAVRTLMVHELLTRSGQDSKLALGARQTQDGRFEAHPWVEVDGEVVDGERSDVLLVQLQ